MARSEGIFGNAVCPLPSSPSAPTLSVNWMLIARFANTDVGKTRINCHFNGNNDDIMTNRKCEAKFSSDLERFGYNGKMHSKPVVPIRSGKWCIFK